MVVFLGVKEIQFLRRAATTESGVELNLDGTKSATLLCVRKLCSLWVGKGLDGYRKHPHAGEPIRRKKMKEPPMMASM